MKIKLISIYALLFSFVATSAFAGTYYVSNGATGNWAGAINRSNPCSYQTANQNAVAGDIVIYLNDGGTFLIEGSIIAPVNSGQSGSPITFKGEDGSEVIIKASFWGADLINKSYIVIENLTFQNGGTNSWISMRNKDSGTTSHHITIRYCKFQATRYTWAGIYLTGNTNHIYIQNNIIEGGVASGDAQGDAIFVVPSAGNSAHHILIEGNDIEGGCHNALEFQTYEGDIEYIVIRNNQIHNPNHTSLNIYGSSSYRPKYVLVDRNAIYDAGSICGADNCPDNICGSVKDKNRPREQHPNLQWSAHYGIIRNNLMYNGGKGFKVDNMAEKSRIYNNVFYNNVFGAYLNTGNIVTDNIFVNNIFVDNNLPGNEPNHPVEVDSLPAAPCDNQWRNNNFEESNTLLYLACNGTPGHKYLSYLETNLPTIWYDNSELDSGFENKAGYDFHLKQDSPLIDAGGWLTTTKNSGSNSNVIAVNDARYFMDGWGIIEGDLVQLEGQKISARIVSVNYSTNTITIDRNISWTNNQGVSLAYKGPAPDIGAYELAITPPTNLRIVQ